MSFNNATLCEEILPHIKNQNVADVLFRHIGDAAECVRPHVPLSAAAMRPGEKLSASRAIGLAAAVADTEWLRDLAKKDNRRRVLRVLARNKNIDTETLDILWAKALQKDDDELFRLLAANPAVQSSMVSKIRENVADWVKLVPSSTRHRSDVEIATLVVKATQVVRPEELLPLHRMTPYSSRELMARTIRGEVTGVSAAESAQVCDSLPFDSLCHEDLVIDEVIMGRLIEAWQANPALIHSTNPIRNWTDARREPSSTLTVEAVRAALQFAGTMQGADRNGVMGFLTAVNVPVPAQRDVLLKLVEMAQTTPLPSPGQSSSDLAADPCHLIPQFIAQNQEFYDFSEAFELMLDNCDVNDHALRVDDLLRDTMIDPNVSARVFTWMFANTSLFAAKFLAGESSVPFTVDRLRELKDAEISDDERLKLQRAVTSALANMGKISPFSGIHTFGAAAANHVDALLDLVGAGYISQHAKMIAEAATKYFGDDISMWETFVAMADVLGEDPLSDMLNGIRVLGGADPLPGPFDKGERADIGPE